MKTIKVAAVFALSFAMTACSSKAPVPVAAVAKPWAEPRVEHLTKVAESQGYEIEREGEQIRLIIPVDGNFHPKRTLLLPSGLVPLSKIAQAIRDDEETFFSVIGHSDSAGAEVLNEDQSLERAQAVANVLMLGGVSRKRMQLSSMGEAEPRADNSTETGRHKNRRVEIVMTPAITSMAMAE